MIRFFAVERAGPVIEIQSNGWYVEVTYRRLGILRQVSKALGALSEAHEVRLHPALLRQKRFTSAPSMPTYLAFQFYSVEKKRSGRSISTDQLR